MRPLASPKRLVAQLGNFFLPLHVLAQVQIIPGTRMGVPRCRSLYAHNLPEFNGLTNERVISHSLTVISQVVVQIYLGSI